MKTGFFLLIAAAGTLAPLAIARAQTVTIYVWLDDGTDTAQPAGKALVEATRSLRLPAGGGRYRQKFQFEPPNKYVVTLAGAPNAIDVGIDHPGYHSLPICDLTGKEAHSVHVRLFNLRTPIAAPECFALKTQYEFLFRREQQLTGPTSRDRSKVQHSARLKYADGLLALPNPNRPRKTQSPATRAMLARMEQEDEDGYNELDNMVDGLFDLYGMGGFEQYVPSKWKSHYWAGGKQINADVEILGTHGTYRTDAGLHRLENIDFLEDNQDGAYIITGNFRFKPGTPDERTGEFRWKVDEQGFGETRSKGPSGEPSWVGALQSGPYYPE